MNARELGDVSVGRPPARGNCIVVTSGRGLGSAVEEYGLIMMIRMNNELNEQSTKKSDPHLFW